MKKVKPVKLDEHVIALMKQQWKWILLSGIRPDWLESTNGKAVFYDRLYGRYLVFYRSNGHLTWGLFRLDEIKL